MSRPYDSMDDLLARPLTQAELSTLLGTNSSLNSAAASNEYNSMDALSAFPLSQVDIDSLTKPKRVYSGSHLGAAISKIDRTKVLKAVEIVASIGNPTGYGGRPSLKDISDKLKETNSNYLINGVRESTAKKNERFRQGFASCNGGSDRVNTESIKRYLECCCIKALASLNEVDNDDSNLIGQRSTTYFNFRENSVKPIVTLYFSQNKDNEEAKFPYAFTKLMNEAKREVSAHLPKFHAKTIVCRALCQLLILCCPVGSYYFLGFCFLLSLLVLSGRRWGCISRMRVTDIDEITILKNMDGSKPNKLHLRIVFKLSRDKDRFVFKAMFYDS